MDGGQEWDIISRRALEVQVDRQLALKMPTCKHPANSSSKTELVELEVCFHRQKLSPSRAHRGVPLIRGFPVRKELHADQKFHVHYGDALSGSKEENSHHTAWNMPPITRPFICHALCIKIFIIPNYTRTLKKIFIIPQLPYEKHNYMAIYFCLFQRH